MSDADKTARQMATSRSQLSVVADEQGRLRSPMSVRSMNTSQQSVNTSTTTPRASRPPSSLAMRGTGTMGKRSGTAAYEYMRRHDVPLPVHGGHRYKGTYKGAPVIDDFDMVMRDDGDDPDESFEGLENVRGEPVSPNPLGWVYEMVMQLTNSLLRWKAPRWTPSRP